jgi:hypothetical protein
MKLFFLFLISILSFSLHAQDTEELIKDIRTKYAKINEMVRDGAMKKSVMNKKVDDEVSEITWYEGGNGNRLIEQRWDDGSHGGFVNQFYVWENELFFIFGDSGYWQFDGEDEDGESLTKDYVDEERCYFNKSESIRCLKKSYEFRNKEEMKKNKKSNKNKQVDCKPCKEFQKIYEVLIKK